MLLPILSALLACSDKPGDTAPPGDTDGPGETAGDTDGFDLIDDTEAAPGDPALALSADALIWEDALLGDNPLPLTLSNACAEPCGDLWVGLDVSGDGTFSTSDDALLLAPGESFELTVTFHPGDYVPHSATLAVESSDPARPSAEVALSGEAAADQDGDGHAAAEALGDDCDDGDAEVYPGAYEAWSGADEDCDKAVDEGGLTDFALGSVSGDRSRGLGWQGNVGAGDFDGDGQIDVLLGAESGTAYVLSGGGLRYTGEIGAASSATYVDTRAGYLLGAVPARAGDLTGDGLPDVVVASSVGASLVAAAVLEAPVGAADDGDAALLVEAPGSGGSFVEVEASLDMDGDGLAELVLGAPYVHGSEYYQGAAWVMSTVELAAGTSASLDDAEWRAAGVDYADHVGSSVGGGDLDGDGYDDLLVGAFGDDLGASDGGAYYLVSGGSIPAGEGALSGLADGSYVGGSSGEALGYEAEPQVADFDGDGDMDLAIAGPDFSSEVGVVYLFMDPSPGSWGPDDADVVLRGEGAPSHFGGGLSSGDVDGDGAADLLVGAPDHMDIWPYTNPSLPQEATDEPGVLYLFSGATLSNASGALTEATADRWLAGESQYDLFAQCVLAADLDGDGRDDILAQAPGWDGDIGYSYYGRVYFIPGR